MLNHKYGWKRDLPDHRDIYLEEAEMGVLPESVDLTEQCPPVYDQGNLGSCTANAIAAHLDFNRKSQGEQLIFPSRLFIYYNERRDDGTTKSDAGSSIRESAKEVVKYGAPPEKEWPYNIELFKTMPPPPVYHDAVKYEALKYFRIIQTEQAMKSCLAQGFPFVCGVSVFSSFEASKTGDVPIPKMTESLLGGHATLIVGYTPDKWIFRNSWGNSWGNNGYGTLPKGYLLNPQLSDDRWTLRQVK